jgi:hypothetical protein
VAVAKPKPDEPPDTMNVRFAIFMLKVGLKNRIAATFETAK